MNREEQQYLNLLGEILSGGCPTEDRTGTGTRSIFGSTMTFDLMQGFPLLTTKRVHWKSIAYELLWFLRGDTNTKFLHDHGITIWDEWADENGDCGPIYGKQWRRWATPTEGCYTVNGHVDQLAGIVNEIKTSPNSRRLLVSAWNPADIPQMKLPPCHAFFQFYVRNGYLQCQVYQRSCDMFLGVPFNIASYALLTHIIAAMTGTRAYRLKWVGGDCHVYNNHVRQCIEQRQREPKRFPTLNILNKRERFEDWAFEDFELVSYDPHPAIKGDVSV